jgi:hypothetical protein
VQPEILQEASLATTKCGKPIMPPGVKVVDIPDGLVYVSTLASGAISTITGYIPITGETYFMVRSIQGIPDSVANCQIQIQWPDGTFFFNGLSNLSLGCAIGSFRRVLSKEMPCPPGTQITITLTNSAQGAPVNTQSIALVFEGVWRYMLQGADVVPVPAGLAESKRYFQSPNGNILAPEWMLDTHFAEIPSGIRRGPYTLVSLNGSIATPGGIQTLTVPVSSAYEIQVRRLTFNQSFSGGATGDLLVRPRDGSGYALYSDYAPVLQVGDAPYAKDWCVRAGVNLFFDFLLRNTTGAGTLTYNVNVVGTRQRRI